jgi:hypothetical protein
MKNLIIEKTQGRKQNDLTFLRLQRERSVIIVKEMIQVSPFPQQSHHKTNYMFHKFEIKVRYDADRLNRFYKKPCSNELLWFMVNALGKYNEKEQIFYCN